MMRSTELWLMSRSCQRATFSSAATALPRSTRARPVSRSPVMGLRLCGMALEPFWPLAKNSSASSTSVRCRWRNSVAQRSMLAPTRASAPMNSACRSRWITWVAIGAGRRPSFWQTNASIRGDRWALVPTAPGELAHGNRLSRGFEPLQCAAKFVVHQRQLQAEGRRFGMDAVAAANHRSELVLLRSGGNGLAQDLYVLDEHASRLHHLHGKGGINHIAAGQAVVQPPAGGRADVFGDVRGEGDDVVIERALELFAPLQAERGARP